MFILRGVTWDNDRAVLPLLGTLPSWNAQHPGISVEWTTRPLSTFAHQPTDQLISSFDLIVLDHPHIGEAAERRLIHPVEELVNGEDALNQHRATVGPTFRSYRWGGLTWAFPIDAACQVAVRRADLLPESELVPSPTWEVLRSWVNANPQRIGLPFNPVLSLMCLFSVCASLGEGACQTVDRFVSPQVGVRAIAILQDIARGSHPDTLDLGDTESFDLMSSSDEVFYIPLAFLYSNYSRSGYRHKTLKFEDIPASGSTPQGGILGGAGLAVSSTCSEPGVAGKYAQWLASPTVQSGIYVEHFGQPSAIGAWEDPAVNRQVGNAFSQTKETIDRAYLRPTYPGYVTFQEESGPIVREAILNETDPITLITELDRLHRGVRSGWEGDTNGDQA